MSLLNKNVSIALVFVAQLCYSQQDTNLGSDEEDILSEEIIFCLLYTSPSPRDYAASRMPSSA